VLKASEGVATMIVAFLRQEYSRSVWRRLAALVSMPVLRALKFRMDPGRYNGASLLGLRGIVIKSHGSADRISFANAIEEALLEVEQNVPERIASRLEVVLAQGQAV
jgi:glycerol-3-phosphate acyltransferase PlsX